MNDERMPVALPSAGLERLLIIEELPASLRVSARILYGWSVDHRGPTAVRAGRALRYLESAVRAWPQESLDAWATGGIARCDTCMQEVGAVAISIRLTPEDEARLERLAQRTGRSKTFYVREAIHEHLEGLEERFWADSVVQVWEESGKESRPAQKLWDELGV